MKKQLLQLLSLCTFVAVLSSCKKENFSETNPINQPIKSSEMLQANVIHSDPESNISARCPTNIGGAGIAYMLQPVGSGGLVLLADITYFNTAPNGFLNMFLRQPGVVPSTPLWKVLNVRPPETGTGYDVLPYNIILPATVTLPLELVVQGSPGAGGCRTTKIVFLIQ